MLGIPASLPVMNYIKPAHAGEGVWAVLVRYEDIMQIERVPSTHLWKILALLSLEKFSSCRDSWVRKATARWK